MLASHAYYAFKVNLLFPNYAPKYLVHNHFLLYQSMKETVIIF